MESPRPLTATMVTTIRLELGPNRQILVEGRVVRNYVHRLDKFTDGFSVLKYRIAMEFISLSDIEREQLQQFINRLGKDTAKVEKSGYSGPDRRKVNRVLTGVGLSGQISLLLNFEILQLSAGGMMISLSVPLPVHSMHIFNVTVKDRNIEVKGEVLDCSPTRPGRDYISYRVVVQFSDLAPEKRELLEQFVSEKLR
jgi:c-di-GMP-binding flagellar brake protein YcgR